MWDSIRIWGGRWPRQSTLPPGTGMRIAAWYWRKRYWLSIHNKVKSEQCFTVTSAKRVAVFKVSLNQVPNSPAKITNAQHSKDQNVYEKEDAVNKNYTLILKWQDDKKPREDDEAPKKAEIAEWYIPMVCQARPTGNKCTKKLANLGGEMALFGTPCQAHQPVHSFQHCW